MNSAYTMQKFQDWFTQQWVIFRGHQISPEEYSWLLGPFGNLNGIGEQFIEELAERESLTIERNGKARGLIQPFGLLGLSAQDRSRISPKVIDFYEHTSDYSLEVSVHWNPFFKPFGRLVNRLFSYRINQLNIPLQNGEMKKAVNSEIITLADPITGEPQYTVWLRTETGSNTVMYSGIYGTTTLPGGESCVKVIFPLPQGNATVIMTPEFGSDGALVLRSSGKKTGDAGFYFLVKDAKGRFWAQFVPAFRDTLSIREAGPHLEATQTLTLYHLRVLTLRYTIQPFK